MLTPTRDTSTYARSFWSERRSWRCAQFVGSESLDELLARKDDLSRQLSAQVSAKARAIGRNVTPLGIKGIILLPGDMKELLKRFSRAR